MKVVDNRLIGTYVAAEYQYLLDYLLTYGNEIKIISPQRLKNDYLKRVKQILQQYEE
mgnify:CR=1 FL=1